jgi:hypothetical protein
MFPRSEVPDERNAINVINPLNRSMVVGLAHNIRAHA